MRINRASRSALLLMELMVSLLLFALAGAACLQVMTRSGELSREARARNRGVEQVSSAAELVRSAGSEQEARELLTRAWPQAEPGEEIRIPMEDGELRLSFGKEQRLTNCGIAWYADGERVYALDILCRFGEDG